MVHLTLAGISEDGKRLLLVSDTGSEFTLDVDTRLRSAMRGDTSRLGQLEITMESALRPRDIQARIRSGETPEAVATAAQTSVERIMAYAGPVLAEREHVAQRAQTSSVRRRSGEGARTLGQAVETHLRSVNVGADSVAWDAWRREDGRWVLVAVFATTTRSGTATFTYDLPGSYVVAEDDDARWLIGEVFAAPPPAPARDDLEEARQRRMAAVPVEEPAEATDAPEAHGSLDESEPTTPAPVEPPAPIEAFLEAGDAPVNREPAAQDGSHETSDDAEPPVRRPVRKSRGRASVPSWDEIMFGSKD